ncbi:MAG: cytochrome b/b6 domain-containing protein [Bacteroidota bacterium]
MKKSTYIYRSFERFWHWSQALVIFFLALTGFEIHCAYEIFGFKNAVEWHNAAGWAFLVLIIFAIFWHFVTGEWKQYIPTTKLIGAQINYYIVGIFKGAPHPTHKTIYNKFNPLQRLIYLGLKILVIPVQVFTGFAFLYYIYPDSFWHTEGLEYTALLHTFGAFVLIAFVIAHVYLTTTGHKPTESIIAMLTGWEIVDVDEDEVRKEHMIKAVENSVAGYYRIDKNGNYIDVNQAWLDMYKCSNRTKIIGKNYSITRDEKDLELVKPYVDRVLQGESFSGIVTNRKCFDGGAGQHILSVNPIYDGEKVVEIEGFVIDINNMEQESDYLPYIIKNSNAAYYRLDKEGYVVDVNDAWLKLYKWDLKSEVIGKHFSQFRPSDSAKDFSSLLEEVISGETISSIKTDRLCSDNSIGQQILSANPTYKGSRINGMEGFILDLTQLEES